jgi:hypothetical protein
MLGLIWRDRQLKIAPVIADPRGGLFCFIRIVATIRTNQRAGRLFADPRFRAKAWRGSLNESGAAAPATRSGFTLYPWVSQLRQISA